MLVLVPFVCAPRFFSVRGTLEPELRARNKVAIGRTCGWIESYALKFFKSGFMDKPSAKRRRGRTAGQPKTVRAQFQYLRKHGIEKKQGMSWVVGKR
jgi:hypothetical protein